MGLRLLLPIRTMNWIVVLASAGLLLASKSARADEREPARYRLLLAAGYGTQDDTDAGSFGAAFGVKLGYTPFRFVHIGIEGIYHVGTEFGGDEINRVHYLGAEGGARFANEFVGLTPYLAFGVASVSSQRNVDNTFAAGYYGAGLSADVVLIDWLMLGVDARLIRIPSGVIQGDVIADAGTFDLLVLAGVQL
jgi:hypothetical protein